MALTRAFLNGVNYDDVNNLTNPIIINGDMNCVYRGQMDDSRPGNDKPVTGHDLRLVLDSILSGKTIQFLQKPSIGCNIKWK